MTNHASPFLSQAELSGVPLEHASRPMRALLLSLIVGVGCAGGTTLTLPADLKPEIAAQLARAPGYSALSHAKVNRPTVERVRAELPVLLKRYLEATDLAAETKSLEPYVLLVPADSRLAMTLSDLLLNHDGFHASNFDGMLAYGPAIVLAIELQRQTVSGVRPDAQTPYGVEVLFGSFPGNAPREFELTPAVRVAEQGGHLVLVAVSPALLRATSKAMHNQFSFSDSSTVR
jgi:hypothetical protein